jgi:hypothetical protein
MYASQRKKKRIVIGLITVSIAVALLVGFYYAFIKGPETCFDNKQNQNEQGIDCGGVCSTACVEKIEAQDLSIIETAFVPGGSGRYDALIRVYNPNDIAGASTFAYKIDLKDASGRVLASRTGKSYILPQERKYIMEMNMETTSQPTTLETTFSEIEWERFSGYQERPNINIYNKYYGLVSDGINYGKASGLVSNESQYDFRSIVIRVILRDKGGKVLAFNSTEQRTMKSREEREFQLIWPTAFPGTVEKYEMETDADVYHSDNFLKQYFPAGKNQEFAPPSAY